MINEALDDFRKETIKGINDKIDENDKKTDELTRMLERAEGAFWLIGKIVAAIGFFLVLVEVYEKLLKH